METPCDWQTMKKSVHERGQYLLESGMWSDCRFIVGTEPHQEVFEGHKLFLAMSSPVFEAMFFGGMPEKDPIAILDVQPGAFKALLEYIYTDKINLTSFDQVCELCYGAKKYMLPYLVEECTKYLWSDLNPKNACRAYEFAKLFEEPVLMEKCLHIICSQTDEVLSESSFDDVELSTIMLILDQEYLNISSELDLFNAVTKYANRHGQNSGAKVPKLNGIGESANSSESNNIHPTVKNAVMKIRFLTLTPKAFAEGPASSNLLTESEKYAILVNISSHSANVPMPPGFSTSRQSRQKIFGFPARNSGIKNSSFGTIVNLMPIQLNPFSEEGNFENFRKFYCNREVLHVSECMNTSVLDCAVTFTCDKNICIFGIQIPAQTIVEEDRNTLTHYSELLYAHLLDADGSRLTYTHFTSRVKYRSLINISFNRPIYIQKNKVYKVGVVLHKMGWYTMSTYPQQSTSNGVVFTFGQGQNSDSVRDGLIRSIIFSVPSVNQNSISHYNACISQDIP